MIFELVDYLAFAAVGLAGVSLGKAMRPKPPAPLRPICSCKHGYGSHQDGKACLVERMADEWFERDSDGLDRKKIRTERCACTRYDGPDPLILGLTP